MQISFSFMVKISLRLDKRYSLSNGKYAVKLAIARNGKTLYIPLNLILSENEWNANSINHVKNVPQKQSLNAFLNSQLSKAELKVQELQARGALRQMTDKELIDYIREDGKEEAQKDLFYPYADEYIAQKKKQTQEAYRVSLNHVKRYCDYEHLKLSEITEQWVNGLISMMREEGKAKWTIISCVNKIKSVYNYAMDKNGNNWRFPKVKLKIPETKKRSLMIDILRKIAATSFPPVQQKYVDIFLLILFMRGINMRDLSLLKADAIKNGRITYIRQKTGKSYDIKIEPEIYNIINKYKGEEYLLRFFDGKNTEVYYKSFGILLSKGVRKAASSIGIKEPISAYYGRHSWATLAVEIGATVEITSAGLGHRIGSPVTQIYIAFRQKQVDEWARKVIDYVYQKGEFSE